MLADSEHAIAPSMAPRCRRVRAADISSAARAPPEEPAYSSIAKEIGCHFATLAKYIDAVDKLPCIGHLLTVALTTADLRALRDYLIASGDAFPVGQVTVVIPLARFELARTDEGGEMADWHREEPALKQQRKRIHRRKPAKTIIEKVMVPCHFCERPVEEAEFRCIGCGEVVCDNCDELSPWGQHDVFEHTAEGSEHDAD